MRRILKLCILLILGGFFISGCSGYDRVLFMTKTNIGLDIDTQPPTAEITIARREIAIQPIFPNNSSKDQESALPLLGSFGFKGTFFNPKITGHFAGGDAAIFLAQGDVKESVDSTLCLNEKPIDSRGPLRKAWHWLTGKSQNYKKEPQPFYFSTDTSFGVKAAWGGTGGPYPDSLKLGYNRKEFASAPVFVDENEDCAGPCKGKYYAKLPSFYAATDNSSQWERFDESGVSHVQFFATGKAATEFAKRPSVRKIAFENMAPEADKLENSPLIQSLIDEIEDAFNNANDTKKNAILAKAKELKLVEDDTDINSFTKELKKNLEKFSPVIPTNLNSLRKFAAE